MNNIITKTDFGSRSCSVLSAEVIELTMQCFNDSEPRLLDYSQLSRQLKPDMPDGPFPKCNGFISHICLEKRPYKKCKKGKKREKRGEKMQKMIG